MMLTDYKDERMDDDWVAAWNALPKRVDGWPDKRRREYKPFLMYEDLLELVHRDEWAEDGALTYFPEYWSTHRG